jgi:hypothetical protein
MSKHLLQDLHRSFFPKSRKTKKRNGGHSRGRTLAMESLETRQMMAITPLQAGVFSQNAGEKPESKIFQYADQWWAVMPNKTGTWVYRLDGTSWTPTERISTNTKSHADVKIVDDLAHVLLFSGTASQYATLEYDAIDNRFEAWSGQPNVVNVPLSKGVETATLDVDSTGRVWIASDVKSTVEVRYSDDSLSSFSAPITVATGISSDDISSIIAMPNNQIGVFWSNQNSTHFGFRVHTDGDDPNMWSVDEAPGAQDALNVGHGMADDHLHLAVASDGTLYAAVKTSYDKSGYPKIGLLVRRTNGVWDHFYAVDGSGTRPVIAVDEVAGQLIIAHTTTEGGGDIVYHVSPLDNISISTRQRLIAGKVNNVTTTKQTSNNEVAFLADSKSVIFSFDAPAPVTLQAPLSLLVTGDVTDSGGATEPTPTEISFQDSVSPDISYAGTIDTQISSSSPTKNYGNATSLQVDGSPDSAAMLKWDVSAIPTGSVVTAAAIELNITNSTSDNYEVYALQRAWDELSTTWQQFADGGGTGTEVLGQLGSASTGTYRVKLTDAGVAAVQAWINDPTSNYGIIVKDDSASDNVAFSSSESKTAALRPKLIVNYQGADSLVVSV